MCTHINFLKFLSISKKTSNLQSPPLGSICKHSTLSCILTFQQNCMKFVMIIFISDFIFIKTTAYLNKWIRPSEREPSLVSIEVWSFHENSKEPRHSSLCIDLKYKGKGVNKKCNNYPTTNQNPRNSQVSYKNGPWGINNWQSRMKIQKSRRDPCIPYTSN